MKNDNHRNNAVYTVHAVKASDQEHGLTTRQSAGLKNITGGQSCHRE